MIDLTVPEIRRKLQEADAAAFAVLERSLVADTRKGVRAAVEVARRRLEAEAAEEARLAGMYAFERELAAERGGSVVIGLDEVGRGPLAGPLAVGGVVLDADDPIAGLNDSKQVKPEVRERIQKLISEYGYKTPTQRQAARAGRGVYRIGVILPSWDAFFIRRMRDGIRTAVHNRGLNDVTVLVEELKNRSPRSYFEAIGRMEERGIDGLIVTAPDTRGDRPSGRLRRAGRDLRLGRLPEPPTVSHRSGYGKVGPRRGGTDRALCGGRRDPRRYGQPRVCGA